MQSFSRRQILQGALALAAYSAVPQAARAMLSAPSRSLHFYNTHTGESLNSVYWENGAYLSDPLKDIAKVLRDHRTGDIHAMDTRLLDILHTLHTKLESSQPFQVISGYRSPKSNAMLHEHSSGVASKSLHMSGMAIDIRLPDRSLSAIHTTALAMQQGGVGYYPSSDFVHVDAGRVRRW